MTSVLIDPGSYDCRNMGDVAMLQVAVARMHQLSPDAALQVFTDDPAELARHCAGVTALPHSARRTWTNDTLPFTRLQRTLPRRARETLVRAKRAVRLRLPVLHRMALRVWAWVRGMDEAGVAAFMAAMQATQLLLICGQGTLSDAGKPHAMTTLRTVETALQMGKPVALMGQGIGPIHDPELSALARAVLPRVGFIGVREGRTALPVLSTLGVAPSRVVVTGDDAIELAYAAHDHGAPGRGIGVHAREARLAISDDRLREQLAAALQEYGRFRDAPLIPLPISRHHNGANDARTIRKILVGYDDCSDGGDTLDTPLKVIAQIRRCRVVVTGAYHAAVFALAQGIPAVCYGRSEYYLTKFHGLADQFGPGCYVVSLGERGLPEHFRDTIDEAWWSADQVRDSLLRAAERQIEVGRTAYQRVCHQLTPSLAGVALPASVAYPQYESGMSHILSHDCRRETAVAQAPSASPVTTYLTS